MVKTSLQKKFIIIPDAPVLMLKVKDFQKCLQPKTEFNECLSETTVFSCIVTFVFFCCPTLRNNKPAYSIQWCITEISFSNQIDASF